MQWTGAWVLLLFVVFTSAAMLFLLHLTRAGRILHERIPDRPRRRMFLASVSFFITFLAVRLLVMAITHHIGPFGWVMMGGRHIHHLVWGIILLLLTGYGWLLETGTGARGSRTWVGRTMSMAYGVGAALTLDEFALWLNLRDVYWSREGRESFEALALFAAALAIAALGGPFLHAVGRNFFHHGPRNRSTNGF